MLLDNSESMFRQNGNRVELVVTEIMKNRLGFQDSFHLLSFAEEPDFEISRVLHDRKDIEDVLAHLMMIQPVNEYTDIVGALGFLTDYISELPLHTTKHILVLSDDVHEPGPGGDYLDPADNLERIKAVSDYIKRNGWKINIVLIPELSGTASTSGGIVQRGLLVKLAEDLGTEAVLFNDDMKIGDLKLPEGSTSSPVEVGSAGENAGEDTVASGTDSGDAEAEESGFKFDRIYLYIFLFILVFVLLFLLIRRVFSSSADSDKTVVRGVRKGDEETLKAAASAGSEGLDVLKGARKQSFTDRETPYGDYRKDSGRTGLPLRDDSALKDAKRKDAQKIKKGSDSKKTIADGAAALSAFASRSHDRDANFTAGFTRRTNTLPSGSEKKSSTLQKSSLQGKPGQKAIEMKVDFQKNKLGHNMHWFDPAASFSVGEPGVSDFEIHSIDVSGVIGTIHRKNDIYTFYIDQPEYYPELKERIENCLGRTIRITSPDTGYTTSIVFKPWISTLERLNRLLHMTEKPGKPDPDLE